jgi:hypothetical protein
MTKAKLTIEIGAEAGSKTCNGCQGPWPISNEKHYCGYLWSRPDVPGPLRYIYLERDENGNFLRLPQCLEAEQK